MKTLYKKLRSAGFGIRVSELALNIVEGYDEYRDLHLLMAITNSSTAIEIIDILYSNKL